MGAKEATYAIGIASLTFWTASEINGVDRSSLARAEQSTNEIVLERPDSELRWKAAQEALKRGEVVDALLLASPSPFDAAKEEALRRGSPEMAEAIASLTVSSPVRLEIKQELARGELQHLSPEDLKSERPSLWEELKSSWEGAKMRVRAVFEALRDGDWESARLVLEGPHPMNREALQAFNESLKEGDYRKAAEFAEASRTHRSNGLSIEPQ